MLRTGAAAGGRRVAAGRGVQANAYAANSPGPGGALRAGQGVRAPRAVSAGGRLAHARGSDAGAAGLCRGCQVQSRPSLQRGAR
eukprot:10439824-Heterocapsa_arctica.AAC.1